MATATQQNRGVQDQFELVLRLQHSRAETASAAHALVHDILRARLQVESQQRGEQYVHAHGFSELGKALAAGRALQLAFEGFRNAAPGSRANISLVLDAPGPEETPTGPSVEQTDLLALAKPSQVLITQALYNKIEHAQPVVLRSFPPCAGVYEFLWTNAERLDELRTEGEFVPTLVVEPEPIVEQQREEETVISYPAPRFSPSTAHDLVQQPVVERPIVPVYEDEEAPARPVGKVIGLSVAAVALIAGCGLAAWHFLSQPPQPAVTVAASAPVTSAPVTSAPVTSAPVIQDAAPTAVPQPPPVVIKPHPAAANPKPPVPVVNNPPRNGKCTIENYEIPQYLDLADKNRNRGNYDAAEREYNTVLACQPGNRAARDGLARVKGH